MVGVLGEFEIGLRGIVGAAVVVAVAGLGAGCQCAGGVGRVVGDVRGGVVGGGVVGGAVGVGHSC